MSNCTSSKCECISLSCGWALKYSPWMGCWGVTYCTLCMSQGPQNIMFEKGNHGNRFHNFKGPNLSVSRCPATSCLLLPEAALELIRAGFSNQPCGKAWLPNHTIDQVFSVQCLLLPHSLPVPPHLHVSSVFLADLVLPFPAAKIDIPGSRKWSQIISGFFFKLWGFQALWEDVCNDGCTSSMK